MLDTTLTEKAASCCWMTGFPDLSAAEVSPGIAELYAGQSKAP